MGTGGKFGHSGLGNCSDLCVAVPSGEELCYNCVSEFSSMELKFLMFKAPMLFNHKVVNY